MNYLIESTICTVIFYGLYLLLFRRFTFVRLNRIYLISSLLVALFFPLISYEVEEIVKIPVNEEVYSESNFQPILVNSSTQTMANEPSEKQIDWYFIAEIVYVLGIIFMLLKFLMMLYKLFKIRGLSKKNEYISTQGRFANSSFFNMIFIDDSKLSEDEIQQILAHEKWHVKLYHSYDLLFVEILKTFFWFNPILWLYQRSLAEIHEYEVDTRMIQVYNPQSYAQLLLKLATSNSRLAATHHFSRKPLTDRIQFIFTKQKSVPMKRLAYLSILPILGVLFMAFSVEKVVTYQEVENPNEKYFKIYEKLDNQVNNEFRLKENKLISNLIYGKNRVALTMNPKELSMDAIVSASHYFKMIGFNLEVMSLDYHNSSNQLDKFEITITEDIDNKKKYRSKISDTRSVLPSKFTFDLKQMKNLDYVITIFADRSTGKHFVTSLAPPPPPPAPPRSPLVPKVPKPPVAPPVPLKMLGARNINATGLIVDSETLLPVKDVELYDENNRLLGTTNFNGYFNVEVNVEKAGEIYFKLTAKKNGYDTFVQREHWGNFEENLDATYYFGLKKNRSDDSKAFSKLVLDKTYKSYNEVKDRFAVVKSEINFDKKVENAKRGNNRIFLKIDNTYYLINESGWIKINSENDKIIVNKERVFSAKELNAYVKRSCVRGMSPIQSPNASFEIYTDCLLQESPTPPVKVGFINMMSRDSIKLIGEGQLGKNPLVIIDGKRYSSNILYSINPSKIQGTALYKKNNPKPIYQRFGENNLDGAIVMETRKEGTLFLSGNELDNRIRNEKKRELAKKGNPLLSRTTLLNNDGSKFDEVTVYHKDGTPRASVQIPVGGKVLFLVKGEPKVENEFKKLNIESLGNSTWASTGTNHYYLNKFPEIAKNSVAIISLNE